MIKMFFIIAVLLLTSCVDGGSTKEVEEVLKGEHKLRRFRVTNERGHSWSAGFFLIAGGASGGTYEKTEVTFSWLMNTGEYAISKIEAVDIRVKIDSNVKEPFVIFNWNRNLRMTTENIESLFNICVNYMVVYCREEDYPVELKISDLVK